MELILLVAIVGILCSAGATAYKPGAELLEQSGTKLVLDIESYSTKAVRSSNAYAMLFESRGYSVVKVRKESEEVVKTVKYPDGVEFARIPKRIDLLKRGDIQMQKKDMTIKLLDTKRDEHIYITIVPASNRVMMTKRPDNQF